MPQVSSAGIVTLNKEFFVRRLAGIYGISLGDDLDLDFESPQGQVINLDSLTWEDVEVTIAFFLKALDLDSAEDIYLDYHGIFLRLFRRNATHTTITATITGVAGTAIPEGSKASTATEGHEFQTDYAIVIPTDGNIDVSMTAVESGPILVPIGELISIIDFVPGWETVNNSKTQIVIGTDKETDISYRARLKALTAKNARGSVEALQACLRNMENMRKAMVLENDTDAATVNRGLTTAARSIHCIVYGTELDHNIAVIISMKKGSTVKTSGTTSVTIVRENGTISVVQFTKVTEIPIKVEIEINIFPGFDEAASAQIKTNIKNYIDELNIGEFVDNNRLIGAIYAVPNHQLTKLTAVKKSDDSAINTESSIDLNEVYIIALEDIMITPKSADESGDTPLIPVTPVIPGTAQGYIAWSTDTVFTAAEFKAGQNVGSAQNGVIPTRAGFAYLGLWLSANRWDSVREIDIDHGPNGITDLEAATDLTIDGVAGKYRRYTTRIIGDEVSREVLRWR